MKTKLNNPRKIKIPFELFTVEKSMSPLDKLGYYLKAVLECKGQIDVSKIWINEETDAKLDEILISYLMKVNRCGKKESQKLLGWTKLSIGPAVDIGNCWNLEDDYIYVEEDFERNQND